MAGERKRYLSRRVESLWWDRKGMKGKEGKKGGGVEGDYKGLDALAGQRDPFFAR